MKKDMTSGKEWKLILLFTLPIMVGNLLQQIYNMADGIIVGNFVGKDALSAVSTCTPLTMLFLALATGLSVGVGIVISQTFGAKRHDELPIAIDTALLLLGGVGLFVTAVALIFTPFLLETVLSVPKDSPILGLATTYFRIYAAGLFFQFIYNGIASMMRGVGDSRATLYILIVSSMVDLVLNFVFVPGFKWGVVGAAASTTLAQVMSAVISYIYLRRHFPLIKSAPHFNRKTSITMAKLGLPLAIQQGIVAFGNGAMQRLVNGFETTTPGVMAAYGAGNKIDGIIFAPIMGFQAGLANFTGQNIGAGRLDRVKRGYHASLIMSMSITVVICVLLYIFAAPVVSFFGLKDTAVAGAAVVSAGDIGVQLVRYLTRFFWMFSGYITLCGLLQGAGDTALQASATLTALVVRIVTGYLFVHLGFLGYNGAWVTTPIGWLFAIAITYTRYFTGGWKKKAVIKMKDAPEPELSADGG